MKITKMCEKRQLFGKIHWSTCTTSGSEKARSRSMQRKMEFKKTEILLLMGTVLDDKAYTKTVQEHRHQPFHKRWPGKQTLCAAKCAQTHTLTRSFSALWLSEAQVTHCAHFSTFTVQGGIETSFHQVIRRSLAMPECDGDFFHFHELTLLRLVSLPFTSA